MADTPLLPSLSRRGLLRLATMSAGLLTLSRLRPLPASAVVPAAGLQVLHPDDAEVLTAIVERMVDSGDPSMPAVRATRTIATIDQALLQLDREVRSQLRMLLRLFEWGPPFLVFKPRRFTALSVAERDDYVRDWATSRIGMRRLAFTALKNLSMLGYYSQDATWKGIHYDGPWAPRPRRVIAADGRGAAEP